MALSPLGDRVRPPRCVGSAELAAFLDRLPEGAPIAIVSGSDEWRLIASLAAERRLLPYPARELAAARPGPALVKEACWAVRTGWSEIARARGWVLATGATP